MFKIKKDDPNDPRFCKQCNRIPNKLGEEDIECFSKSYDIFGDGIARLRTETISGCKRFRETVERFDFDAVDEVIKKNQNRD